MEYKLTGNEALMFHKLSCVYEDKIKGIKTDKDFCKEFPETAKKYKEEFPKKSIKKASSHEIAAIVPLENTMFMTVANTLMLCFFRHLRNAYSHNLLWSDNKYYYIEDNNSGKLTARGKIEKNKLHNIIAQLDKEYLQL